MTSCPIDKNDLQKIEYDGVEGLICKKCQGNWLRFKSVKNLYDKYHLLVPAKIYHEFAPNINHRSWPSKIRCPDDQEILTTHEFKNIEIDICETCKGLWLDKGEIDKLRVRAKARDRVENFVVWLGSVIFELIFYR